jgi:predicted NAD/FAD-binding protein
MKLLVWNYLVPVKYENKENMVSNMIRLQTVEEVNKIVIDLGDMKDDLETLEDD